MDIKELKKAKYIFEQNIAVFIFEQLEDFRRKTDLAVSFIDISLNEINSIGEGKYYQVGGVYSEIDL